MHMLSLWLLDRMWSGLKRSSLLNFFRYLCPLWSLWWIPSISLFLSFSFRSSLLAASETCRDSWGFPRPFLDTFLENSLSEAAFWVGMKHSLTVGTRTHLIRAYSHIWAKNSGAVGMISVNLSVNYWAAILRALLDLFRLNLSRALGLIRKDSFSLSGQVEALLGLFLCDLDKTDYSLHVLSLSSDWMRSSYLTAMGSTILCLLLEPLNFFMMVSRMATLL